MPSVSQLSEPPVQSADDAADQSAIMAAVADTIDYLAAHWQEQPGLEQLARRAGWSPAHFQRAFADHVGVSPKRLLQYLTVAHARDRLDAGSSLLDTALDSGLSGPGRLHDLFLAAEAMTPGEYKAHGASLIITYGWCCSPVGPVLIGVTERGICWLAIADAGEADGAERQLHEEWEAARLVRDDAAVAPVFRQAMGWLDQAAGAAPRSGATKPPRLLLRGTNFQLKVWNALMRIPPGRVLSYGQLAREIGAPRAVRAVGSACGANLVSWLVPCHRAVTSSGMIHAYRWGVGRKRLLLAREFAAE